MTVVETTQPTGKKKRGRENGLDMIRSLAVVFLLVIPLWFFGQASPGDSKRIRPIDPTQALHDFVNDTGGPVPTTPDGWIPNVQAYDGSVVRIGYVIHNDRYAEFQGSKTPDFVHDATGKGTATAKVDVGGVLWQEYVAGDGHESLVLVGPKATVLVGGVREDATLDELKVLAATVR